MTIFLRTLEAGTLSVVEHVSARGKFPVIRGQTLFVNRFPGIRPVCQRVYVNEFRLHDGNELMNASALSVHTRGDRVSSEAAKVLIVRQHLEVHREHS